MMFVLDFAIVSSLFVTMNIENKKPKDESFYELWLVITTFGFIISMFLSVFTWDNLKEDSLNAIILTIKILTYIFLFTYGLTLFSKFKERKKKIQSIRLRIKNNHRLTIDEFYTISKNTKTSGVYVLFNENKNKYYVGQSKNIVHRVKNHIEGRGNAHLFADLKYGDIFYVHLIEFTSEFRSLNEQEKYYINIYDSFNNGYNKTRGGS